MMETNLRSIIKTISWRLTGSLSTFIVSFLILNNPVVAGSIAIVQMITNTLLYYVHERIWNLIYWGKYRIDQTKVTK